jgi:hypothetical protein
MSALNTSGIASLLIEKVQKIVEDGIEKKDVTFSRVEKSAVQSTNSLGVRMPVMVEDNASEEWRSSEGADFAPSETLRKSGAVQKVQTLLLRTLKSTRT